MTAVADLIPHAGAMVLLDEVTGWDNESIACRATTHAHAANPLRVDGQLPILAGVEYAAQAMAAHGRLIAPERGRPRGGVLASLRAIVCHANRLDDIAEALVVTANRLTEDGVRMIYGFTIESKAGAMLLEGRAAVILEELPL